MVKTHKITSLKAKRPFYVENLKKKNSESTYKYI